MTPRNDPGMPSREGEPPPEWAMRTYVLGLIYRGPNRVSDTAAADELQRAHLANNARLYEEGTHAELLARGGIYARLYELQYRGQREEASA